MHQARLGILLDDGGDDTDDGDDAFSVMERLDKHLMRSLENMHSPSPWVRQSVVLSLSAVHGTSLLAVINAALRMTFRVAPDHGRSRRTARRGGRGGGGRPPRWRCVQGGAGRHVSPGGPDAADERALAPRGDARRAAQLPRDATAPPRLHEPG